MPMSPVSPQPTLPSPDVRARAQARADPLRRALLQVVPGALPGLAVWVFMSRLDAVIGRDDGGVAQGKRPNRGHDVTGAVDGSAATAWDASSASLRLREGWVLRHDDR